MINDLIFADGTTIPEYLLTNPSVKGILDDYLVQEERFKKVIKNWNQSIRTQLNNHLG